VTSGAQDAATKNGFKDTGGGLVSNCTRSGAAVGTICVEVNNPPKTGPHGCNGGTCDSNYVETLVAAVQPTFFMKVLSINSQTITARAVATNLKAGPGNGCLYALGLPSASLEGINISISATLNAPNCAIVDNGDFIAIGLAINAFNIGGVRESQSRRHGRVGVRSPWSLSNGRDARLRRSAPKFTSATLAKPVIRKCYNGRYADAVPRIV